jgi:hypothetical protein
MQTGFDSSYSDYGMLDDLPAFHCAQDKSLPTTDEQFNGNYPFNEQKNVNVYGEQASELIILFSQLVLLVGTIKSCIILLLLSILFIHHRLTKGMQWNCCPLTRYPMEMEILIR